MASVGVTKLGLEAATRPSWCSAMPIATPRWRAAIVSKYSNMGQTCVCANCIDAEDRIYDEFVQELSRKVVAIKIGDGTEQGVVQGPLINLDAVLKVEKHIDDALKGGANVIGGVKESGLGREGSHHGMEAYVEIKYVMTADVQPSSVAARLGNRGFSTDAASCAVAPLVGSLGIALLVGQMLVPYKDGSVDSRLDLTGSGECAS